MINRQPRLRSRPGILLLTAILAAGCGRNPPATSATSAPTASSTATATATGVQKPSPAAAETDTVAPDPTTAQEPLPADYVAQALPEGALARLGKGIIYDAAIAPDGESVVLATSIGVYRYLLGDGTEAPEEAWFTATTVPMTSVAFSPDGSTVAAGSYNNVAAELASFYLKPFDSLQPAVLLLDARTGSRREALVHDAREYDYRIARLAFSPDGALLAAGFFRDSGESLERDARILLWNLTDGTSREFGYDAEPGARIGGPNSLGFSPDGTLLASGAYRTASVRVWDAATGNLLRTLDGTGGDIGGLAFSPDGKTLAAGEETGTVVLWNTVGWTARRTLRGSGAAEERGYSEIRSHSSDLQFSPEGKMLAVGAADGSLALWDAATGNRLRALSAQAGPTGDIAFSADGNSILSVTIGGAILRQDALTGGLLGRAEPAGFADYRNVALSPDSRTAFAFRRDGVDVWDLPAHRVVFSVPGQPAAVSSDGKYLAAASDKFVKIWDAASGEQVRTLAGHTGAITTMAFSPDSGWLATGGADKAIGLWNIATGKVRLIPSAHAEPVDKLLFSPDGLILASGSADDRVMLWDARTGALIGEFATGAKYLEPAAFSPDGATLACVENYAHVLHLVDPASGDLIRSFDVAPVIFQDPVFFPDGSMLALYSYYYQTELIPLRDSADTIPPRDSITGPGIAFSPDGAWGAGADLIDLVIWDTAGGKWLHDFRGHTRMISHTAFSRDSRMVVSVSEDGTILLWDLTR